MTPDSRCCLRCGGSMAGRAPQARYCSHTCKQYAYYHREPEMHQRIREIAGDRAAARRVRATLDRRTCETCGHDFQPAQHRSRFCSPACGRNTIPGTTR